MGFIKGLIRTGLSYSPVGLVGKLASGEKNITKRASWDQIRTGSKIGLSLIGGVAAKDKIKVEKDISTLTNNVGNDVLKSVSKNDLANFSTYLNQTEKSSVNTTLKKLQNAKDQGWESRANQLKAELARFKEVAKKRKSKEGGKSSNSSESSIEVNETVKKVGLGLLVSFILTKILKF